MYRGMVAPCSCPYLYVDATLPDMPLVLHFGEEPHTTGHHLSRALRRVVRDLTVVGRGHPATDPGRGAPLLWVESGRRSLPTEAELGGRRTAAWLIDTHRDLPWHLNLARAFETVFVAQRDAVAQLERHGVKAQWLPLAFPSDLAPAFESDPTLDVDFVGNVTPGSRRSAILTPLAEAYGIALNQYVSPEAMIDRYSRARVVVNVPLANDLNMRLFEAAGAGAHVVTSPMDGLADLVSPRCYTVVDSDLPADWIDAIAHLLLDRRQLDRSRADRRLEVRSAHTYDHRAAEVLTALASPPMNRPSLGQRRQALSQAAASLGLPRVVFTTRGVPISALVARFVTSIQIAGRRRLGQVRRSARWW